MKFFISFMLLNCLTAVVAFADFQSEVKTVSSLQYDGTNLEVNYRMGGGCEQHTGTVQLNLDKANLLVSVKIIDVSPKEDFCEAYIGGSVNVNLKEKVTELLKANGLSSDEAWAVKIELPKVEMRPFDL